VVIAHEHFEACICLAQMATALRAERPHFDVAA
jgi:hypothetical protein